VIILVCGGRDYLDRDQLYGAMDLLDSRHPVSMIVEGGAQGADTLAGEWAESKGIHRAIVPALWDHYGKSAGYKRNSAMLLLPVEYCVAFPGGKGTKMMADLCARKEIPVWYPIL
jgi:hypothetical protein